MAIVTLADFKAHIGVSGTSEDSKLEVILLGAERAVESYCGRRFGSQSYTHEVDGSGAVALYLPQRPVTAVESVHVAVGEFGGTWSDDLLWSDGSAYMVDRTDESEDNVGRLLSMRGVWPRGFRNVRVVYTAGYTRVPYDVKLAVMQLGAAVRADSENGRPVQSETLGDYSYTLLSRGSGASSEIGTVASLLSRYRTVAL